MGHQSKTVRRSIPVLKRHRFSREPKRRFTLFCEGKRTEPAYFNALKRAYPSALIDVIIHPGVGVPFTIAKKAVEFARHSRPKKDSFEKHDQVWAVFDRDQHPRFQESVALCGTHGIKVARSNPCFEVWLILHEQDYNKPNHRRAVQRDLQKLRPEYDKKSSKTPYCYELVSQVRDAEQRAEKQLKHREQGGDPYGNPSTTVGRLCRAIREAHQKAS
ncbi:MAG: RloB domain-containing protein [Acidobacteriia bacterium]|nr:RloB domain-containing protein [Terriglobia bacterium]